MVAREERKRTLDFVLPLLIYCIDQIFMLVVKLTYYHYSDVENKRTKYFQDIYGGDTDEF